MSGGQHLITDEETRRIAESFLAASRWLGEASWDEIVVGPGADWPRPPDAPLQEGQSRSWRVQFTDPAGESRSLDHEVVLNGVRKLVYVESGDPLSSWPIVQQWFVEPADERRRLELPVEACSLICETALYGRSTFARRTSIGGISFDLFKDQRIAPGA